MVFYEPSGLIFPLLLAQRKSAQSQGGPGTESPNLASLGDMKKSHN